MPDDDLSNKPMYKYDVALSFAGENRDYVENTALVLKGYGIKVFYDKFEEVDLWGKDLFSHLKEVYSKKAKYTVMFISEFYKNKLWTTHERKSMQERAFRESEEYILPVRFDNTEIPGLYETIGYIDLKTKTPSELADLIIKKLNWKTSTRWWGEWKLKSHIPLYYGGLTVTSVDKNGFYFSLYNINGAHSGSIEGVAKFKSKSEAIFISEKDEHWDNNQCTIDFIRTNDIIQITENSCSYYHGARSHFDGDYELKKDAFYNLDIFNDIQLTNIYSLLKTDDHWKRFLHAFNDIHIYDQNENFQGTIITGGAAGLYTTYEAILIISSTNDLWAAYLYEDKVHYFTNSKISAIPKDILSWSERFKDPKWITFTKT